MKISVKLYPILFFALVCFSQTSFAFGTNNDVLNVKASITNLRSFYFQHDFESGMVEGQKFAPVFGDSNELKAWYILNMARNENAAKAIAIAEEMVQKSPDNVWSWFALAGAMNWDKERGKEALEISETAYKKDPNNSDIIWLRAEVLRRQGLYFDAHTFIEENLSKVTNPAELLVTKALVYFAQGDGEPRDDAKIKLAFDTFNSARTADLNCVNAYYLPASFLFEEKKYNDAYLLLKTAVVLAPTSLKIHTLYWQSTTGSNNSVEKKIREIENDIALLLKARTPNVKTLDAIARQYANLNLKNKRAEFEERILKEFNDSASAERILSERYREFAFANRRYFNDAKVRSQYHRLLRDFTKRPKHYSRRLLSEAYQQLFIELKNDASLTDKDLLEIVKGMAYNDENNLNLSFIKGTQALLKRNIFLKDAEQIILYGFNVAKRRAEASREYYKSQNDFDDYANGLMSEFHDMLGWILFKQGRNEEAEKELLKAYELDKNDADIAFHLSQLYETTKRYDKAEEFYVKGLGIDTEDEKNPNVEAVRAFYAKLNGNMKGYEEYQTKLYENVAAQRKVRILSQKISKPEQAKSFTLRNLSGQEISLSSLKGKVVVINFWGIWCTWCVKEMPEFQTLSEKYAKDSDVVILTINNDGNASMVQNWMKEKRYDFTVLLEDGYNSRVGIRSYPTTWFIDKEGRIAYIKRSYSSSLVEEFSLRIEDLKDDR
jgi:thiol-disulfide isomerase/thioredoxin/predicted Zn-dependent protease